MNAKAIPGSFIVLIVPLLVLTGCSPEFIPNRVHAPLLKEKTEVRGSVNPRNLQLAYSPRQGLGLMLNGYYNVRRFSYGRSCTFCGNDGESKVRQQQLLLEAGAGYYRPLSKDSSWTVDLYAGYGVGKNKAHLNKSATHSTGPASELQFSSQQHRGFVQPSLGVSTEITEVIISARLSALRFAQVAISGEGDDVTRPAYFEGLNKDFQFLAEPCLTFRFGPDDNFKFETQMGLMLPLTQPITESNHFISSRLILNGSLHFVLAPRLRE